MSQYSPQASRLEIRQQRFYQESAKAPLWSVYLTFATGMLSAWLVSVVMVLMTLCILGCVFLGVLYLIGFFIPVIHSVLVCIAVSMAGSYFALRNQQIIRWICIASLTFAYFCFVQSFFWLATGAGLGRYFSLLNPVTFISELFARLAGESIGAIAVYAVLAIILFALYFVGLCALSEAYVPYCEPCGRVCKTHDKKLNFLHLRPSRLRRGDFQDFTTIETGRPVWKRYQAELYFCTRCGESNYVRVWRVWRTERAKEPGTYTDDRNIVYNLLIVPAAIQPYFDTAGVEDT